MCYYVLQETVCGASGCGCIFLGIVLRGLCNDPKEPKNSIDLCRGGNSFWFWIQGSFSSNGSRPQGCCPACLSPDFVELMPSKVNIETAPKIEDWPKEDYEEANGWTTQVPYNQDTGNDLEGFARNKLAYQKACFGGLPGMSWVWFDQIDQAEVDREAERTHESVRTGEFLKPEKEDDGLCPILAGIDGLDSMFEPSQSANDHGHIEPDDEDIVIYSASTPVVQ